MNRRFLLLFLLMALVAVAANAIRAVGVWTTVRQSDGTTLEVLLRGDEWLHYYITRDRVPLVREESGDYCYAEPLGYGVKSSGVLAHEAALRSETERRAVRSLADVRSVAVSRQGVRRSPRVAAPSQLRTTWQGSYRGLVILASFTDRDFSMPDPVGFYDALLNKEGYDDNGAPGSVSDYFLMQSGGQLSLTFDVVGPIKTSYTSRDRRHATYGRNSLIPSALRLADNTISYRSYDWDGDGEIEMVFVIYAGYGANEQADSCTGCIWPHKGTTVNPVLVDGNARSVSTYACCNEIWADGTNTGLGTICHEFSHCFGLPDLYDVSAGDESPTGGISDAWDLMDGGNYNEQGWCPPGFSAYEKMLCGWLSPTQLDDAQTVVGMAPQQEGGDVFTIVNDACPDEFYVLENRQQQAWDRSLPGHGLLVTHVDYDERLWQGNNVNADTTHFRIVPIPADNNLMSYYYNSQPLTHAAYPYVDSEGVVVNDSLTDFSTPAARLYHARADGALLMGKPLRNIRETDGRISFDFGEMATSAVRTLRPSVPAKGFPDVFRFGNILIRRQPDGTYRKEIQ